jgi:hypothetical protein
MTLAREWGNRGQKSSLRTRRQTQGASDRGSFPDYTASRWRDGTPRPLAVFFVLLYIPAREARLTALADVPKNSPKNPQDGPKAIGPTQGHKGCKTLKTRKLQTPCAPADPNPPNADMLSRQRPYRTLSLPHARGQLLNRDKRSQGHPAVWPGD